MDQYIVTGMSCAACAARVEKAVNAVPGVSSCAVSLLTNSMGVEGTAGSAEVIAAVEKAGYGARKKNTGSTYTSASAHGSGKTGMTVTSGTFGAPGTSQSYGSAVTSAPLASSANDSQEDALADHETPKLKRRLLWSLGFLLVLIYIGMGHGMFGLPLPAKLADNPAAIGILQMLLASIVMVINQKFFVSGFRGLLHRSPNMDTLVAMGSMTSFLWSVYVLLNLTDAVMAGDTARVMSDTDGLYFESAAMILTLITVGKMLEARSKGKTTDALKSLMRLAPKTACIERNGAEVTVPVAEVRPGDVFLVRPGESVPVDGTVLEGSSAVNESALTGESIPVDKAPTDRVSAGTVNQSGFLRCKAERVGEDTTLSGIIRMVSEAAATKAPIARVADKVAGVFVPAVLTIAAVTTVIWLLVGRDTGFALARGISVLVISCPCALGLATPVAIMVANGVGAKHGILYKTSAALEETGRIDTVVLDKTGTVTTGEPMVTDLIPAEGVTERQLLELAASLEEKSEHPLARAVMAKCAEKKIIPAAVENFAALPGNGLRAVQNGNILLGGNMKFISQSINCTVPDAMRAQADRLSSEGKTPLFFADGERLSGIIAVADALRPDSQEAIRELHGQGLKVIMLTGDNERTASAIGKAAGVDEVIAGVLPDGKEAVIRKLKVQGKVAMVGDGINDAPALTRADVGIAIGAGADVAVDAADVVLMKSRMRDVPAAVRLSRAALRNIHENLFWAFFYNVIGIPLAAGAYIHAFGWELNPMFGAAAMSLSSFCVVSNALRLNLLDLNSAKRDRPVRHGKCGTGGTEENAGGAMSATQTASATGTAKEKTAKGKTTKVSNLFNKIKKLMKKEKEPMKKTMKIEGMMCPHCEAAVRKALEALEQVESAEVSHVSGTAIVTLKSAVDDTVLKQAVEAKDYTVLGIE